MPDKETPTNNESSTFSEDKKLENNNAVKPKTTKATVDGVDTSIKAQKNEPLNTKKDTIKKAVSSKKTDHTTIHHPKAPLSKLALFALIIAASAIVGSAAHYVWQQEQSLVLSKAVTEQRQTEIQASQTSIQKALSAKFSQQLEQKLAQQQKVFTAQLKEVAQLAHQESEGGVTQLGEQLSAQVNQLEQRITQRQPSDWLIHEAEYLIRVAARTMWLESDTKAAIGLLKEADTRLSELKQPKFLPIRALINQDIAALALMPNLEHQQAILALMALNNQILNLPLAGVNLNEAIDNSPQESIELSTDVNDWQTNLNKSWKKFLKDFITVRRRAGTVEPLMAPEQQQNLKQNLSLKIQLAQWAASEQKEEIYQETLLDIQSWMNQFFDMKADINQKFYQSLEEIKQHTIYYDYPSGLSSLTAIKRLINKATVTTEPQTLSTPVVREKQPEIVNEDVPSDMSEGINEDENGEKQ